MTQQALGFVRQTFVIVHNCFRQYFLQYEFIFETLAPTLSFLVLFVQSFHKKQYYLDVTAIEFMPLAMFPTMRYTVVNMLEDKRKGFKEYQKLNGLHPLAYQLGWLIFNVIRILYVAIIFLSTTLTQKCYISSLDSDLSKSNAFLLYSFSALAFSYFIVAIFENPSTGGDFFIITNLLGAFCSISIDINYFISHHWIQFLFSLLPAFAYNVLAVLEIDEAKPSFSNEVYFGVMGFDLLFYTLLYLYFNEVLPTSYGESRHPLFFLGMKKGYRQYQERIEMSQPLINQAQEVALTTHYEEFDNLRALKKTISVNNLSKSYDNNLVLQGITFSVHDSQIFSIVGTNGSGKSVLMKLLGGMLERDSGFIDYAAELGFPTIGFCLQEDILYQNLTVQQHIDLYWNLKDGVIEHEKDLVINSLDLGLERYTKVAALTESSRKRLSLAISFLGDPKILLLDDPTRNLDSEQKRLIWKALKAKALGNTTIIVATSSIEEAIALSSDRFAILRDGSFFALGSLTFMNEVFKTGLQLQISQLEQQKEDSDQNDAVSKALDEIQKILQHELTITRTDQITIVHLIQTDLQRLESQLGQLKESSKLKIQLVCSRLDDAYLQFEWKHQLVLGDVPNQIQSTQVNTKEMMGADLGLELENLQQAPHFNFFLQVIGVFLKCFYSSEAQSLILMAFSPIFLVFIGPSVVKLYCAKVKGFCSEHADIWLSLSLLATYTYFLLGISVATAFSATMLVKERELKQKFLLNVMGLSNLSYWFVVFFLDLFFCAILLGTYVASVKIFQVEPIETDHLYGLVFACGFAYMPLGYLLSLCYSKAAAASRNIISILIFFFYMALFLIYYVLWKHQNETALWCLSFLSPSMTFASGINAVYEINYIYLKKPDKNFSIPYCKQVPDNTKDSTEVTESCIFDNPEWFLIGLIVEGVIYFLIVLLIEYIPKCRLRRKAVVLDSSSDISQGLAVQDIQAEFQNCRPPFRLQQINFRICPRTVFGLVGPHSSGKSTIFNIVTANTKCDYGAVLFDAQNHPTYLSDFFLNVGVCPQEDCLYQSMTPYQHLKVWAYMKGYFWNDAQRVIQYYLALFCLQAYADVKVRYLTPGIKRKVSIALAFIGGKKYLLLDEPTAKIDNVSRAIIQQAIQKQIQNKRELTVFITTQNIQEASRLCSRMAILTNGEIKCQGEAQEIINMFQQGYILSLKINGRQGEIKQMIVDQFMATCLSETAVEGGLFINLQYKIEAKYSMKNLISFIENMKSQFNEICDYSLSEVDLNSIYSYYALQQYCAQRFIQDNRNCCCCKRDSPE